MSLSESIERALTLQQDYSASMTPLMEERLKIVHDLIPNSLREHSDVFAELLAIERDQLLIQGRANLGQNSEIPWIRIADKLRSPSATKDWYVVFLFAADGSKCWVQIGRGSTTWNGQSFTNLALEDLRSDCGLLRQQLVDRVPAGWSEPIELRATRSVLGAAYEAACALGVGYVRGNVPDDSQIIADVGRLVSLLERVYEIRSANAPAVELEPEVAVAVQLADQAAKPQLSGGQGFGLTAAQRKAVELRAVTVATEKLIELGWEQIVDVGATQSYDLDCTRGDQKLFVEVKGSTGAGGSVILTKNEVDFHRTSFPDNALAVVSGISLDKDQEIASGGKLHWFSPWELRQQNLTPLSYIFNTGIE